MSSKRNQRLYKKGFISKKTLKDLDDELSEDIQKETEECKERIHNKLLSVELIKNGLNPIL